MNKQEPKIGGVEKRQFTTALKRMEGENEGEMSRTVVGSATVYNERYDMGWYFEEIAPGAMTEAIKNSDCRALFNHDANYILARQSSKTLTLSDNETELTYEFETPETSYGNDLLVSLSRGDIAESSFAFTIKRQTWIEEKDDNGNWFYVRRIEEIDKIYDVSPVTYPANPATSADTRSAKASFDAWMEQREKPQIKTTPKLKKLRRRRAMLGV